MALKPDADEIVGDDARRKRKKCEGKRIVSRSPTDAGDKIERVE
jgi:hypothetical protein